MGTLCHRQILFNATNYIRFYLYEKNSGKRLHVGNISTYVLNNNIPIYCFVDDISTNHNKQ